MARKKQQQQSSRELTTASWRKQADHVSKVNGLLVALGVIELADEPSSSPMLPPNRLRVDRAGLLRSVP